MQPMFRASIYVESCPFQNDKVILNKKEDCPFVIRTSKFNHKISLFQRQKAFNLWISFQNITKFNLWWEGGGEGGEGGVRAGVEKKEKEELKEQIDVKVSTKFQINPSTNGWKNALKVIWGQINGRTDGRTNQRTSGPTDQPTKRRLLAAKNAQKLLPFVF
jgi:hypothetical protein